MGFTDVEKEFRFKCILALILLRAAVVSHYSRLRGGLCYNLPTLCFACAELCVCVCMCASSIHSITCIVYTGLDVCVLLQVHDYLRSKLCSLYENDCIFDKFECAWNGSDRYSTRTCLLLFLYQMYQDDNLSSRLFLECRMS